MAYNTKFNPDALPAHAEPDQAAQMIAQSRPGKDSGPAPPPKNSPPLSIPQTNSPQQAQAHSRRTTNPVPSRSPVYGNQGYGGGPGGGPPPTGGGGGYGSQQPVGGGAQGYGQQTQYGSYGSQGGGPGSHGGYNSSTSRPDGGLGGAGGGGGGPLKPSTSPRPPGAFPQQKPSYGPRHDSLSSASPHGSGSNSPHPAPLQVLHHGGGGGGGNPQTAPGPGPNPGPPSTPGIPVGGDSSLLSLFHAVDTRGTGQLSEDQLGRALKNGDYTSFDRETVRLMIRMFDHDRSGSVGFDEFSGLWGFLSAWRALFDRFDEDRSGHISFAEYSKALTAFGYHLTPRFVELVYAMYDRPGPDRMSFDLFVQSCISLKRMTDVFKKYDTDRDGFVTLSFEEFLTEILNQRN